MCVSPRCSLCGSILPLKVLVTLPNLASTSCTVRIGYWRIGIGIGRLFVRFVLIPCCHQIKTDEIFPGARCVRVAVPLYMVALATTNHAVDLSTWKETMAKVFKISPALPHFCAVTRSQIRQRLYLVPMAKLYCCTM